MVNLEDEIAGVLLGELAGDASWKRGSQPLKSRHERLAKLRSSFTEPVANPTAYGVTDTLCYSETGTNCLWFNNSILLLDVSWKIMLTEFRPSGTGNPRFGLKEVCEFDRKLVNADLLFKNLDRFNQRV